MLKFFEAKFFFGDEIEYIYIYMYVYVIFLESFDMNGGIHEILTDFQWACIIYFSWVAQLICHFITFFASRSRVTCFLFGGQIIERLKGDRYGMEGTLLETNISLWKVNFEDDFPFPKVGYVSSL